MRVDRLHELEIELLHQLEVAIDLLQHGIDDERFAAAPASEDIAVGARDTVEQLPKDHRGLSPPRDSRSSAASISTALHSTSCLISRPQSSGDHVFNDLVVQHASIEIDERCDRAGFNDRLGDIAPSEILDCADRSPARENEKFNRIAELTLAQLRAEKSGNARQLRKHFRAKVCRVGGGLRWACASAPFAKDHQEPMTMRVFQEFRP